MILYNVCIHSVYIVYTSDILVYMSMCIYIYIYIYTHIVYIYIVIYVTLCVCYAGDAVAGSRAGRDQLLLLLL